MFIIVPTESFNCWEYSRYASKLHDSVGTKCSAPHSVRLSQQPLDGAIHRAGGPSVLAECRQFKGGCPAGEARITGAGQLKARNIIHAVGPVWDGGERGESELLSSVYRYSLQLAMKHGLRSIAFPSISTGAYRFPLEKASEIAVKTCREFCQSHPDAFEVIRFVCFSARDLKVYSKLLSR